MKILLVIDQFDQGNNGTTISARRFAQALAADGNEVRVAAAGKPARGPGKDLGHRRNVGDLLNSDLVDNISARTKFDSFSH